MLDLTERVLARLYIMTARRLARTRHYSYGGDAWTGER